MNVLAQIATFLRVCFVGSRQAFEGGTKLVQGFPIEAILICLSGQNRFLSSLNQGSRRTSEFLTDSNRRFLLFKGWRAIGARSRLHIMATKLELMVDYNSSSHPISAKCSGCGKQMPIMEAKGASSTDSIKWFAIQLDLHVRQEHSREDFSRAAARIVR